jgi:hypothetical protein
MKDGLYEAEFGTTLGMGTAQLTLRDGVVTGRTSNGLPIAGRCSLDPRRNLIVYEMTVEVPPNTDTLSGFSTGDNGRAVMVRGEKAVGAAGNRFSFGFAGRAVDVAMRYVAPLKD